MNPGPIAYDVPPCPPLTEREKQLIAQGVFDGQNPGARIQEPELVCAWCLKEAGITQLLSSGMSHGICKRHLAIFEAELQQGGAR
jgi:hypothetical protein